MLVNKTLDSVVEEVLLSSSLNPKITAFMLSTLKDYYSGNVISVSDSYPDTVAALYAIDDEKMYSIVSFSYVDEYVFILMPAEHVTPGQHIIKKIIAEVKNSNNFTNVEIGETVRQIQDVRKALTEVFSSSTRTTRRATGTHEKVAVLPSLSEMQVFYECGRKVKYLTYEEALVQLDADNQPYFCSHCKNYHQGRLPSGDPVPQGIMEGRWRTTWRRMYHV